MSAPSNVSLFRWEVVDLRKQREDAKSNHLASNLFTLSTRPLVQFALFISYYKGIREKDFISVILKQTDGKPIEVSVRLWIEHVNVEKHVFSKIEDQLGCRQINDSWNILRDLYDNHNTFFICCELTDLNAHLLPTVENYQEFLQNHLAFYEQELHDAVITVGKTEFKVMKTFLMCQSEVFKSMFLSKFKEGITSKIEIKDIDVDTMKHFVEWFYMGKLEDKSPVEKLFAAADKYDVKLLKKMCAKNMLSTLDKKNAFDRLILASTHSDTQFKEDILDFISKLSIDAFTDFLTSDEWMDFAEKNKEIAKEVRKLIRDKMRK